MKASHKRFCYYYLNKTDFNASEAARMAGYSEKNAANIGSRLLKKESIKAYVSQSIEQAIGAKKPDLRRRIVKELEQEAFQEGTFTDETKGGTVTRANPNKLKALELLAKYSKLLEDAPTINNITIPIHYDNLPGTARE